MKKQCLGWISVSDDDLCSDCVHLLYRPGGFSYCQLDWPCKLDADMYVESCEDFSFIKQGHNVSFVNIRLAKAIWEVLGDLPVNEDNEIDEQFLHFRVGTDREVVWHWIEDHIGVAAGDLMHNKIP